MAIIKNSHKPDKLDIYFHMINHYKRIRSARSHFSSVSDLKKIHKVSYTNHRANIDLVHYPNHSERVKKHSCIIKNKSDRHRHRLHRGSSIFRPVTRRNITDMPISQVCSRDSDHTSKYQDHFSDQNTPNEKPILFYGTPQLDTANICQEFMDAAYYETPCDIKCKHGCHADRKIDRRKFAYQEHVTRIQNAKQRYYPADCKGGHKVTYCDGYTQAMTDPRQNIQQPLGYYENPYNDEPPMYKPAMSDGSTSPEVESTRSFGTSTFKVPPYAGLTHSIGTETCTGSKASSYGMAPSTYSGPSPRYRSGSNALGGGCKATTCPILKVTNKSGQTNAYTTQILSNYGIRNTSAQTDKEQQFINVTSSQAKDHIQCSERCPFTSRMPCSKDVNCRLLPEGDKYCEDVPSVDTQTQISMMIEEIRKHYNSTTQLENDDISQDIVPPNTDNDDNDNGNKGTSTAEALDNEPNSNILDNGSKNEKEKAKGSSSKKKTTYSTRSNNVKQKKIKTKSKERNGKIKTIETTSALDEPSINLSLDPEISISTTNSLSNDVSPTDLGYAAELSNEIEEDAETQSATVKEQLEDKDDNTDILRELQKIVSKHPHTSMLKQVIEHFIMDKPKILLFESSDGNANLEFLNTMSKEEIFIQPEKLFEAVTTYMKNISQGIDPANAMEKIELPLGYNESDISNILKIFYEKLNAKYSELKIESMPLYQTKDMDGYIENMTDSLLKLLNTKLGRQFNNNADSGLTTEDIHLSHKSRARILSKQLGGSKTNKKVCTKRKGLRHTFKDPEQRVCESLLNINTENKSGFIDDHEYLQFSLRITEDIIRNDLYTNGQMKRVFKSHLEANRGRLDTQKMIDQVHSLCLELNIPFDEQLPFENITPTLNCDTSKIDKNTVCYCKEQSGTLEATKFCTCNLEYYTNIFKPKGHKAEEVKCDCGQDHCTEINCPGTGYREPLTEEQFKALVDDMKSAPDFDFANEGILQTVMYSETHCLGPRNKHGECNCVAFDIMRPNSPAATGYIPSFGTGASPTRKPATKNGPKRCDTCLHNQGKLLPGLRIRGVNRKDGVSITPSNSNEDSIENSAPVRIKTPVTALRTKTGTGNTDNNNFVIVQCPVLVPTENLNLETLTNTEDQTTAFVSKPQPKVNIEFNEQAGNRTAAQAAQQLKEDMQQAAYANEINETLTDPLAAVSPCNNCSCNEDCKEISKELTKCHEQCTEDCPPCETEESNKEMTVLMENTDRNQCDNKINDGVTITNDQNMRYYQHNDLPKAFATSGLKSRLEELTAVTLAISNKNMQSLLEKHPAYKPKKSCTTCHFNANFIRAVESTNIFYPSKALNTVYSKCLFQQNNLLLGDEYVMFNPYSVRPETILHYFPSTCTQVGSDDLIKASESSLDSNSSGVTDIVDNIIRASKENSESSSIRKLSEVPPENLVKAIKNEINKISESRIRIQNRKESMASERGSTSSKSQKSSISSKGKKIPVLPVVAEALLSEETDSELDEIAHADEFPEISSINETKSSETESSDSVSGKDQELDEAVEIVDEPDVVTVVSVGGFEYKEEHKTRPPIKIKEAHSDSSGSSSGGTASSDYNNWMKKLDNVPSIKMTPSLKGSFDKALSDTDKFRVNNNVVEDGPIIAGMMQHFQQASNVSNTSPHSETTDGNVEIPSIKPLF